MKPSLIFFATCLFCSSIFGGDATGTENLSTKAQLKYGVSIEETPKDGVVIVFKLKNEGKKTYYIDAGDIPGVGAKGMKLIFSTDLKNILTTDDYWHSRLIEPGDRPLGLLEVAPSAELVEKIFLSRYYDRIDSVRKRSNVYIAWKFQLTLHDDNEFIATLKKRPFTDKVTPLPPVVGECTLKKSG